MTNEELGKLIGELDKSTEKTSEHSIFLKINKVKEEAPSFEAIAESIAFNFCEDYSTKKNGWGTYYGPMIVWLRDDGKTYESPSITLVDNEIVEYWKSRSRITKNPIMKARYSGLIWDLSEIAISKKPDYKIAIDYVNALLDIVDNYLCEYPAETITKITRAYEVASGLNSSELIRSCIESAIKLESIIAEDDKPGLWGFCFELFVLSKSKNLCEDQKRQLVEDLESRLVRVSKDHSPWVCESAGIPLATYYRSKEMNDEVTRVVNVVGCCFEEACEDIAPMRASLLLQHMHDVYIKFNLKGNAERVSKKISEVGPKAVKSMQKFSHSTEISLEKIDAYLDSMTSGGLEKTLNRIVVQFLPKKDLVEQQVLELAKYYPFTYLITKILQDHKGRPVATIGGIEGDLEGNTIHQLSENMNISSFLLRKSFNKASELYEMSAEDITDFVYKSPIFEESKKGLILVGVRAYLNQDYISAIHVLVPQAEAAIRMLVELMDVATSKRNKHGGMQLRSFDDLLRDDCITNNLGTDLSFYFRILLTDQRGWNMRNDVCHGISPLDDFNYSRADRIMHIILCLAKVRKSNI